VRRKSTVELKKPKEWTFWFSFALVFIGILMYALDVKILSIQPLGLIVSGYGILLLGNLHPSM
jgi:hypothetical protein